MKVLIVGANFENKGAQSMLFIAVDEIKRRMPGAEVYFAGVESFDESRYTFHEVYYSEPAKLIALNDDKILAAKCTLKDCVKLVLGRRANLWRFREVKNLMPKIDLMVDISGFNLGEKWSVEIQQSYLNNIRLAKKYNIPIYLMPQSFGPFNYTGEKKPLLAEIRALLPYASVIFAREKEGYDFLARDFGLNNVRLSTDLVLQNSGIALKNVYTEPPKLNVPHIENNAVAIIPNKQCFNHGDRAKNLQLYGEIIRLLADMGKRVYIFRHSREDLPICEEIAAAAGERAALLTNDFSCFEYDELVKQFDFIICSRYHGIVHAYRNYVPAIALGWAIKYAELARRVGQAEYAFDITDKSFSVDKVLEALRAMDARREQERGTIRGHVLEIQKDNCFDYLTEGK